MLIIVMIIPQPLLPLLLLIIIITVISNSNLLICANHRLVASRAALVSCVKLDLERGGTATVLYPNELVLSHGFGGRIML